MLGFNALSSAPIAATGAALVNLQSSLVCAATSQAALTVVFNAVASINTTANVAPNLVLDHLLDASILVSANVTPLLILTQPLETLLDVSANITGVVTVETQLSSALDVTANVEPNLVLDHLLDASILVSANVTPLLIIDHSLEASVESNVSTSALLGFETPLETLLDVSANITGVVTLDQQLSSNLSAAANVAPNLVLDHPLAASIQATANVTPLLIIDHPLEASVEYIVSTSALLGFETRLEALVDVSANITGLLSLNQQLSSNLSAAANVAPNLVLDHPLAASIQATDTVASLLILTQPLEALVDVSANITGLLSLNQQLSSNLTATASASSDLAFLIYLSSDISVNAVCQSSLSIEYNLDSTLTCATLASADITITKNLSAEISVSCDITVGGTNVNSAISVSALCAALLDVDGNTDGSIGGFATEGFSPQTSVVLAQHVESANAATYTITADFGAGLETEIMSVSFNDNPANVLSYLVSGNQAFITANTPADVYAQASTFIVNRELVPVYNTAYNYKVRFNTAVKKDLSGNNFYSGKFYSEGNSLCFLSDDGRGIVDLYEELAPGAVVKLKSVGIIDYATGYVQVEQLVITSKYDATLFFFVESLDAVIPTQDYFTQQNNLLVQSKTLTFPTGEQVEITQYEKQTDIVDLEIYVTARSYAAASPLVTIEERTATYILRIVPDYDVGKTALLQLLAEQAA